MNQPVLTTIGNVVTCTYEHLTVRFVCDNDGLVPAENGEWSAGDVGAILGNADATIVDSDPRIRLVGVEQIRWPNTNSSWHVEIALPGYSLAVRSTYNDHELDDTIITKLNELAAAGDSRAAVELEGEDDRLSVQAEIHAQQVAIVAPVVLPAIVHLYNEVSRLLERT
jgi:hypothetical protein